jgi:formate dehydrogenase iron-sulfur subunit
VMIYVFTRREFWNFGRTGTRFLLTSAVLGIAATWLTVLLLAFVGHDTIPAPVEESLAEALLAAAGCKLLYDAAVFRHLLAYRNAPLKRSARLMAGPLSNVTLARFATGLLGGVVMPAFLLGQPEAAAGSAIHTIVVAMLFAACVAGELLERYLFFGAVSSARMPGGLRS